MLEQPDGLPVLPDYTFQITADDAGQRLDKFLTAILPDQSRSTIQRLIENGDVLLNERLTKSSYKLRPGDQVEVEIPPPLPTELRPEPLPLNIVHEDEDLIVVNKPAGLVVHPGAGVPGGTLANGLLAHFNQLSGLAGSIRPGIVHRIDRDTSGLLVVAKNNQAHQALTEQFSARTIYKRYTALCYGQPAQSQGTIDEPIGRDPHHRICMAVRPVGGRPALTLYRVRERYNECTLVDAEIKTGRTHQIRVHFTHLKHPIVGDKLYSEGRLHNIKNITLKRMIAALNRQFLHAVELGLTHPRTGQFLRFEAPLPPELQAILTMLREQAGS